ncbi:hypothetical protein BCR37DRAFT_380483 [Protomyces lactucae-debilis]|uniref:Uncharacterized protein n=1 Tax=Protomyces lactucae-debilis TaxID=2754530 RepID=A0A1Y2FFI5_PROLT|nr:uncharacterized protein BCR37DRAFT_380483 [Protomyces lactucae-debilis]ORY81585.1 hypothetical protein BCR37DRAFT_380483 [Protomyces lactucae-debilis]
MCMPRLRFVLGSEMSNIHSRQHASLTTPDLRDVEKVAIDSMGSVTSESSQLDLLAPSPYPALSSTSKSLLAMEDSPVQMRQRLVH